MRKGIGRTSPEIDGLSTKLEYGTSNWMMAAIFVSALHVLSHVKHMLLYKGFVSRGYIVFVGMGGDVAVKVKALKVFWSTGRERALKSSS